MSRYDNLTDDELLALMRGGDDAAFAELHDRFRPRLLAYARRLTGSQHDAEDVLQDVFAKLHAAAPAGERDLAAAPWLFRVVHNRCVDLVRSRGAGLAAQPDSASLAEMPDHRSDPHAAAMGAESLRATVQAISALPERQREALVLSALEGRTHDEIAQRLGTNRPGSKSLVLRARLALARDRLRRGAAAAVGPFLKPVVAGVVVAVGSPAVLIGAGTVLSDHIVRPGDPAPRTALGIDRGEPMPAGLTYVEARVLLPSGPQRGGRRRVRLTCPEGLVFGGGMSAGGGAAAPALRSAGLSRARGRAGRFRSAQIQFLPKPRLDRDYVARFGIVCMTRARYRRERARGRRLDCKVFRSIQREHADRGTRLDPRLRRAMRSACRR